jgi:hypothetical protein
MRREKKRKRKRKGKGMREENLKLLYVSLEEVVLIVRRRHLKVC